VRFQINISKGGGGESERVKRKEEGASGRGKPSSQKKNGNSARWGVFRLGRAQNGQFRKEHGRLP